MIYNMESILRRVYSSRKISLSLRIISHISVAVAVLSYSLMLWHFYSKSGALALKFLIASAVPLVLVSLLRHVINAPRPYELYGFYSAPPKGKRGHSFPSRHTFSIFLIATFAVQVSLSLSVGLFLLGAALACARVLLGVHFIRDVAAGALVGIVSAVLGIFIIF